MKNILREAWFLVIPGALLLVAAVRDILSHSAHLRMDAPLSAAVGLALLACGYAFRKPHKWRGTILVLVSVGVALVYPRFIASDATFPLWLAVCLFCSAGAIYLSLTHRRI